MSNDDTQPVACHEHELWMRQAIQMAGKAGSIGEVPIGAVIVKAGEVIGRGYNRREVDHNPLGHAELMAIREASRHAGGWRLTGCTLYVTLEPCPMCAGAAIQSRLDTLVFGAYDPKAGYAGTLANTLQDERLNHQVQVVDGVLEAECRQMLQSFFKRLRNK